MVNEILDKMKTLEKAIAFNYNQGQETLVEISLFSDCSGSIFYDDYWKGNHWVLFRRNFESFYELNKIIDKLIEEARAEKLSWS